MNSAKPDNKPYDTAFKDLAEQDPEALLRLIGALPEGATIKPLPREMTAPALFTDQPYEVTTATEHFVAHLEAQTYYDDDIPSRTVKYDAILWVNTGLPVRSYILIFSPRGMPPDAPSEMTIDADGLVLIVRFHLIKFWELDARRALAMNSESLIPFIPLMDGKKEDTIQGLRELSAIADELRRRELAVHFLFLGSLRYSLEEVFDMIERYGMVPIDKLKESPAYQFILSTGIEKGIRLGVVEGREEGRKEGREEGRQLIEDLLLSLIEERFPGLDLKAEIDCIHDAWVLKDLCAGLNQFADAEQLRAKVIELIAKK